MKDAVGYARGRRHAIALTITLLIIKSGRNGSTGTVETAVYGSSQVDYSLRHTDLLSPQATFRIDGVRHSHKDFWYQEKSLHITHYEIKDGLSMKFLI